MVITIDGPSGAGKSSISRALAGRLGFAYLDSGALYRAVALAALWEGCSEADEAAIKAWLPGVDLQARPEGGRFLVLISGRDVEPFIRNEEIGGAASRLSAMGCVREFLLKVQQRAGMMGDLVCEGRDMGTVIFPRAELKFFLTASDEVRAQRRLKDLLPAQPGLTLDQVLAQIKERDQRDSARDLSPLKPASDAQPIDSSGMDFDEVLDLLAAKAQKARQN